MSYCHAPHWSCADIRRAIGHNDTFRSMCRDLSPDRYDYVNLNAYWDHGTFELRLLEGTINADDICNWITMNCRFIDAVKDMNVEEIDETFGRGQYEHYRQSAFAAVVEYLEDTNLEVWMLERNRQHNPSKPLIESE